MFIDPKLWDDYIESGDESCLSIGNVEPANIKIGDEYVVCGEGWSHKIKILN